MKKIILIIAIILFAFTPVMADLNNSESESEANANNSQGQGQGQGQQQGITNDMFNNSFNSKGMRGFAVSGEVQYGPTTGYFIKPLPSEGFMPIEQITMYACWYTEGALENMLKGVEDAEAELKIVNEGVIPSGDKTNWIKVVISANKYGSANTQLIGILVARSDSKKTTMVEVMAKAALSALQAGCNVIHFTSQGAVRDVFSSGWGIGISSTQANISGGQNVANVTSAGTGYSSAKAGARDLPWLQGFGLYDPDLKAPASREKK